MWEQADDRLRRNDAPYYRIDCPEYDATEDAKRRSLGRIVIAIIATILTLAIVAIAR